MVYKLLVYVFIFMFPLFSLFGEDNTTLKQANYILGYTEAQDLKSKAYVLDFLSFKQGLLDGYSNHIPESIESKKDTINKQYIDWIIDKQTSTFAPKPLDTNIVQTFSYFIGADYGKDFKLKYFTFFIDEFIKGIQDCFEEKKPLYDINDQQSLKMFYSKAAQVKKETENNKAMALVDNEGFNQKLEKGISYSLISTGAKALKPTKESEVVISYTLSELDQSHITNIQEAQTGTFKIKDLAEGVKISVLSMQLGEHSIFSIPTILLFTPKDLKISKTKTLLDITLVSINSNAIEDKSLKEKKDIIENLPESLNNKRLLPKKKKHSKAH